MNIGEILKTKRWKVLMGYVYGWGAAAVMIGALFKLQHWPYSGIMLTVGLLTEAFIFFLSAFEPPSEIPDWAKVYPELREDYELLDEFDQLESEKGKFDELFQSTDITPELLTKVSKSLIDLSNTASSISDISTATLATDVYVKNLNTASETMSAFSEINSKANQVIDHSVEKLTEAYTGTAHKISEAGQEILSKLNQSGNNFTKQIDDSGTKLAESYNRLSSTIEDNFKELHSGSGNFSKNLVKLNDSIDTLNTLYTKQIEGTNAQLKAAERVFNDMDRMNQIIDTSVQEIKKYKENAEKLNSHLEALNSIYGNMLNAMNFKKK